MTRTQRPSILLSATLLAVALLMLFGLRPVEAAFPGMSGNIVFQRNSDIWLRGTGIMKAYLTPGTPSYEDVDPATSPNGRRIAFTSNRDGDFEIFTLDINGGTLTKVTRNTVRDAEPAWSPDGSSLGDR